jgi:pimeloyl-ACP methyl ester carboxylesterase
MERQLIPTTNDNADFRDYATAVLEEVGNEEPSQIIIVVGQSMGAFTAPLVAKKLRAKLLVLLAPMIPTPGETPTEWWQNTGQPKAVAEYAATAGFDPQFDIMTTFMHDIPKDVVNELMAAGEPPQSPTIFEKPFPLDAWPDIETKIIACTQDRMFPLPLVQRLSQERLGVVADEIESGHLAAFSHPNEVATKLCGYAKQIEP